MQRRALRRVAALWAVVKPGTTEMEMEMEMETEMEMEM